MQKSLCQWLFSYILNYTDINECLNLQQITQRNVFKKFIFESVNEHNPHYIIISNHIYTLFPNKNYAFNKLVSR